MILDTNGLRPNENYTIGCELYNEINIQETKTTAMAKVNTLNTHQQL